MPERAVKIAYETLTSEDDGRVCRDIPEEACDDQPRNFMTHVLSLSATKTGDGLVDPKLVLSWLLTALGAPAVYIGLLVPVREAGSLLPQLVIAGRIRAMPRRKWAWALGSLLQGIAVAGMALVAFWLDSTTAALTIIGLLGLFAVARSVCSVSYKDVLGKTVSKSTRGTATGSASTVAACLVLTFGLLLSFGVIPKTVPAIATVMLIAAGLWLAAAALLSTLPEPRGATEGGGNPISTVFEHWKTLRDDPQLVRFIACRGLLTATALAPPHILALAGRSEQAGSGELGLFVIASSLAAATSTYIWGRLSDRSSRKVLMVAGAVAGLVLILAGVAGWLDPAEPIRLWLFPVMMFVLMLAYQGVRLGRSTHLVDMADEDTRVVYTALSNTIIGVLLLISGAFGVVVQFAGIEAVLLAFGLMSLLGTVVAVSLQEVQGDD